MSTYSGYSSTLSPSRLSSYTPSKYSGSYSSTSSYLYKPPLSSSSYRSTLPVSSYLGSSYYSSTGSRRNSASNYYSNTLRNTTNLSSSYLSSSRSNLSNSYLTSPSSTSNLKSNYYSSSTSETPIRRNSSIDSISFRPIDDKNARDCQSSSYLSKNSEDHIRRAGLHNLGNTCFMNAVLQCLSHTQPLVDYCMRGSYNNDMNLQSPTRGELIRAFADVVQKLIDSKNGVNATPLKVAVTKCAPIFIGNSQHDAQEFLRYLMQGLHDDIKRKKFRSSLGEDYGSSSWKRYQDSDDSYIVDLFAGQLKSTLQCTNCKHESVTYDPFWDLSLPIPEGSSHVTLRQCFNLFSLEEELDEDNKAFCDFCKKKNRSSKKFEVHKFPRVLVIHLKRFTASGYGRKINVRVDCPLTLNQLTEISSRNCFRKYELYGVVDHTGSVSCGHYVSKCKNPNTKEWYEFDDLRVSKAREVVTENTYLLFYIQE